MLITVLRHEKTRAYYAGPLDEPLGRPDKVTRQITPVPRWPRKRLFDALKKRFESAAMLHPLQPASWVRDSPATGPRFAKTWIGDPSLNLVVPVGLADVDRTPKEPWPENLGKAAVDFVVQRLTEAGYAPTFAYSTRCGLRVGWILNEPCPAQFWRAAWGRFLTETVGDLLTYAPLNLDKVDTACLGPEHNFYLPKVRRNGIDLDPYIVIDEGKRLTLPVNKETDEQTASPTERRRLDILSAATPETDFAVISDEERWKRLGLFAFANDTHIPNRATDPHDLPPNWVNLALRDKNPIRGWRARAAYLAGLAVSNLARQWVDHKEILREAREVPQHLFRGCEHNAGPVCPKQCHDGEGYGYYCACVAIYVSELADSPVEQDRVRVLLSADLAKQTQDFISALRNVAYRMGSWVMMPHRHGLHPVTNPAGMRLALHTVSHVIKRVPRKNTDGATSHAEIPVQVPTEGARAVMSAPGLESLREVQAVVHTPAVRPDGTIALTHGFDAPSGLYYAPGEDWPDPPDLDAPRVAERLTATLWSELPFIDECDRALTLALALTGVLRPTLPFPVPWGIITGNRRNIGKTKLARSLACLALGRVPSPLPNNMNATEFQKQLVAAAKAQLWVLYVDNQTKTFGNSHLAELVTSMRLGARIFQTHDRVDVPFRTFGLTTMNDGAVDLDFESRTAFVRLERDPNETFRPTTTSPDVLVERDPNGFRMDLLAIYAEYTKAGKPNNIEPWPRFEQWTHEVAGCVEWATGVNPLSGSEAYLAELKENNNPTRDLLEWICHTLGHRQTSLAGTLIERRKHPTAEGVELDAILSEIEEREQRERDPFNARSLAKLLTRLSKNPPDGYAIEIRTNNRGRSETTITGPASADPAPQTVAQRLNL